MSLVRALALAAFAAAGALAAAEAGQRLTLTDYDPMAVCLDGTPGAAFLVRAPAGSRHPNTYVIYFEGGGWCDNVESCEARSKMYYGTSSMEPPVMNATAPNGFTGILSRNCSVNPLWCDVNVLLLHYCDGFSFMGSLVAPIVAPSGAHLYIRGSYIRKAALKGLLANTDAAATATEVLLAGCSAGGLSTFLHSSSVHAWVRASLPKVTKMKAAPVSGFFLARGNADGEPVYPTKLMRMFHTANASADADPACLAAQGPANAARCIFAETVYATQAVMPTFVLNSQIDMWQSFCILLSTMEPATGDQNWTYTKCVAIPRISPSCVAEAFPPLANNCTAAQLAPVLGYQTSFLARVADVAGFHRAGNGAFIDSCFTHCQSSTSAFWRNAIGGVTAEQALSAWWAADGAAPAAAHTTMDCTRTEANGTRPCNPTCDF